MKYADLIRAALDGKKIQTLCNGAWETYKTQERAVEDLAWASAAQTIKQFREEPKPDEVRYGRAINFDYPANTARWHDDDNITYWTRHKGGTDNIKAVFDGTTGLLKSLEMV